MGKKDDVPLKEKYRLFWEYLKRSGDFKRIEAGLNKPSKERDPNFMAELRSQKRGYVFFRQLFWLQPSFEEWWDKEFLWSGEPFVPKYVKDTTDKVKEFGEYFRDLQNDKVDSIYISKYFDTDSDFPPADKFDVGIVILNHLYSDLNISIKRLDLWSRAELEKEIRKIISIRKRLQSKRGYGYLTEKMRYKQVKRYLDVYDRISALKEKKISWEEITKVFYPNTAKKLEDDNLSPKEYDRNLKKLENHQRRLKMEYSKAKKIILNAEKGQFPGKY